LTFRLCISLYELGRPSWLGTLPIFLRHCGFNVQKERLILLKVDGCSGVLLNLRNIGSCHEILTMFVLSEVEAELSFAATLIT
jgi:hypothetical protein